MREVAAISPAYAILLLGEEMRILQFNYLFSLMTLLLWGKRVGEFKSPALKGSGARIKFSSTGRSFLICSLLKMLSGPIHCYQYALLTYGNMPV